jgi:hypothetical protein
MRQKLNDRRVDDETIEHRVYDPSGLTLMQKLFRIDRSGEHLILVLRSRLCNKSQQERSNEIGFFFQLIHIKISDRQTLACPLTQ